MAGLRILAVDDEREELQALTRLLQLAGYEVWAAQTAKDALNLCDQHMFDLIVLDFIMPNMTGVELLGRVRKKLPHVRSIIISGKIDGNKPEAEVSNTFRERIEADLFLKKPVSGERLKSSIEELLSHERHPRDWKEIAKRALEAKRGKIKIAKKAGQELRGALGKPRRKK
jgi:two-component system response regulator YesN